MHPPTHLLDLPPEIHSKILFASLKASFDEYADESRYRPHVNLQTKLALVCRLWANLITAVPELWTQLSINLSRGSPKDTQRRLRRAGAVLFKLEYPLSLRIMAFGNHDVSAKQAIIDFIARHIDRCQVLDIRVTFECWSMLCRQGLEGAAAERLETLRVHSSAAIAGQDDEVFDLAERAPRLSSFTCQGIYMNTVKLPWTNLTNLDLRGVTIDECLSVLTETSNVEHLSIVNIIVGVHPPIGSALVMKHLTSFAVFDHAEHELAQLMARIEAPRLEYFSWMSDVLVNKPLTLDSLKRFMGGAVCLATFVVMHDDPDALVGWVLELWGQALAFQVVVLKPNVLDLIKAPSVEVGQHYCRYGTREWDDVLLFLPSALPVS